MNQFEVDPSRGEDFERSWRERESYLGDVPGFVSFALLKGDDPGDYISHTTWVSRDAFLGWAQSEAFRKAHGGGMPDGILRGHPRARFYDAVIEESPAS